MIKRTCALEPECVLCHTLSGNGVYNPETKKFICQECLDDMACLSPLEISPQDWLNLYPRCQIVKDGYIVEEAK